VVGEFRSGYSGLFIRVHLRQKAGSACWFRPKAGLRSSASICGKNFFGDKLWQEKLARLDKK
jgi:hypothetical protein